MRSFVIKTSLDLFNNVLESFPRFYIVCITCIQVVIWNQCNWVRVEGVEKAQKDYCTLVSLGRDRVFWFCVAIVGFVS